jgi:hypothetical protein
VREISTISARSCSRVWRIMNSRSGCMPRVNASASAGRREVGLHALVFTRSITGAMVKSVRKSARLISTVLGGVSCMPIAWRSIDSTITMRTKDVTHTRNAGARLSTVRPTITLIASATSSRWPPARP